MKPTPEKQSHSASSTSDESPLVRLEAGLLDALADDFEKYGREVVEKVRLKSPDVYLRVIAATLCGPAPGFPDSLVSGDRAESQKTIDFLRRADGTTRQ